MNFTFDEKLEQLINQFLNDDSCGNCCSKSIISFYSKLSIEDAIKYACDFGKNKVGDKWIEDSHFKKLNIDALQKAEKNLLNIKSMFKKVNNFIDVYSLVRSVTEEISGLNRMFYYDVSFRIAACIGESFLPQDVFYQRGTELGAIKLGILTENQIDEKKPYLPYRKFLRVSKAFEKLKPYQIEDFLCIYHTKLDFGK